MFLLFTQVNDRSVKPKRPPSKQPDVDEEEMYAIAGLRVVISRPQRKDGAIDRLPCRTKLLRATSTLDHNRRFESADDYVPT